MLALRQQTGALLALGPLPCAPAWTHTHAPGQGTVVSTVGAVSREEQSRAREAGRGRPHPRAAALRVPPAPGVGRRPGVRQSTPGPGCPCPACWECRPSSRCSMDCWHLPAAGARTQPVSGLSSSNLTSNPWLCCDVGCAGRRAGVLQSCCCCCCCCCRCVPDAAFLLHHPCFATTGAANHLILAADRGCGDRAGAQGHAHRGGGPPAAHRRPQPPARGGEVVLQHQAGLQLVRQHHLCGRGDAVWGADGWWAGRALAFCGCRAAGVLRGSRLTHRAAAPRRCRAGGRRQACWSHGVLSWLAGPAVRVQRGHAGPGLVHPPSSSRRIGSAASCTASSGAA